MPATLVGSLLIRLVDKVTGKAKGINAALKGMDRTARDVGKGAGKGLAPLDRQILSIEKNGRRLARADWGVGFQNKLDRLGVNARGMNQLNTSWTNLHDNIKERGLKKALRNSQISAWKTAAVGHFAEVQAQADRTKKAIKGMRGSIMTGLKPAMVAMGGYTAFYMIGSGIRGAGRAMDDRERAKFHQEMAGLPESDRTAINAKAGEVNKRFPNLGRSTVMELAFSARNLMGSVERGNEVVTAMSEAMVVLNATKGGSVAMETVRRMLLALDIMGKNKDTKVASDEVRGIIDLWVKRAIIDPDFDPAGTAAFARRAKVAGLGWNKEFLGIATTFMQSLSAPTTGKSLSSAFNAFVIGTANSGGKKARQAQVDLGIRKNLNKGTLINPELFVANPYAWVKEVLIPAMEKKNIDLTNKTAVLTSVSMLTNNAIVQGMFSSMVLQREQVERDIRNAARAQGLDAADKSLVTIPSLAAGAFVTSLKEVAAALGEHVSPTITPGLKSMADSITSFAEAVRTGDATVGWTAAIGTGAVAGYGAFKFGKMLVAIAAAGPALVASAGLLDSAALAIISANGGGSVVKSTAAAAGGGGLMAGLWKYGKKAMRFGGKAFGVIAAADVAYTVGKYAYDKGVFDHAGSKSKAWDRRPAWARAEQEIQASNRRKTRAASTNKGSGSAIADMLGSISNADVEKKLGLTKPSSEVEKAPIPDKPGVEPTRKPGSVEPTTAVDSSVEPHTSPLDVSSDRIVEVEKTAELKKSTHEIEKNVEVEKSTHKVEKNVEVEKSTHEIEKTSELNKSTHEVKKNVGLDGSRAKSDVQGLAGDMERSLSIKAKPIVDSSSIDGALAKAKQLKAVLDGIASSANAASNRIGSELRRVHSDVGVTP